MHLEKLIQIFTDPIIKTANITVKKIDSNNTKLKCLGGTRTLSSHQREEYSLNKFKNKKKQKNETKTR